LLKTTRLKGLFHDTRGSLKFGRIQVSESIYMFDFNNPFPQLHCLKSFTVLAPPIGRRAKWNIKFYWRWRVGRFYLCFGLSCCFS